MFGKSAVQAILSKKLSETNPPYESASLEPDAAKPSEEEMEESGMDHASRGMVEALHAKDHKSFGEHMRAFLSMYDEPEEG